MEADWEVEAGGEAPLIDALWPGFVDLRLHPERAWQLPEVAELPTLAEALATLNGAASLVWTSKCDVWPVLEPDEFDPDELDAPPGFAAQATGCYIDLLSKSDRSWPALALAASWCKGVCAGLRAVPLRCCRVDFVVRRALISPERMNFGITAYLTACGPSEAEANRTLQAALAAFARALCGYSTLE
jgi:hypothetical protein